MPRVWQEVRSVNGSEEDGKKTGERYKEEDRGADEKQLTRRRQIIQSLLVRSVTKNGLFFLFFIRLIALFADLVLLGRFFTA